MIGPVADVGNDVDGAAEGFDLGADSVHLGDLAVLNLGHPGLGHTYGSATCACVSPALLPS